MAESFVKTMKYNYVTCMDKPEGTPDASTSALERRALASQRRRNWYVILIIITSVVLVPTLMWWATMRLAHDAWDAIGQVLPGLTNPHRVDPFNRVITAIHDDNVEEYLAARTACGKKCDPDMTRNDEEQQFIELMVEVRAWPILAAQIQSTPQVAQRLLHIAGNDYSAPDDTQPYGGAPDLVNFLLDRGAKADGLALANAVVHCRTDMTQILLQNGADPRGEYPVPERFVFEGPEALIDPPKSPLTFAAEQHCDPAISAMLTRFGARQKEWSR
jgi:hypothetical protein